MKNPRERYAPMDLDDTGPLAVWALPSPVAAAVENPHAASVARTVSPSPVTLTHSTDANNPRETSSSVLQRKSEGCKRRDASKEATRKHRVTESKQGKPISTKTPMSGDSIRRDNSSSRTDSVSNHLVLPYIFMGYLRLAFTLFTMGLSVYIIVQFILTVRHDLEMKAVEYSSEIIQQVHECSKLYLANKCSPIEQRLPAMQTMCSEWESCMSKDPHEIGRLKVGAEAIAEVLNRLFEPLSIKTMIFTSVLFFGTLYLYFTAPSFQSLRTLPANLQHFQQQHNPSNTQHFGTQQYNQPSGSISTNSVPMPQFGIPASASQMHHHYYGVVPNIHGAHQQAGLGKIKVESLPVNDIAGCDDNIGTETEDE
ncbi:hypothetical protein HDU82_007502 [Entophlyctis luteolus]|nr:hypothetical protein HDU82_007502 [Entophlyctis luteolus]